MTELKQGRPRRRLYRRATAAALLDTSINMLKRLEKQGKLTPLRLGGRDIFYRADEVDALAAGEAS